MPKPRRPENRGLPVRWRYLHGAYYYQVPRGLEPKWGGKHQFRLGSNLGEAYRTWSTRLETRDECQTIGDLLERYALEVVPSKAPKTQTGNLAGIRMLREVFGRLPIGDFTPVHAYRYRDKRGQTAPTAANRELEVLSHAFTKAIEWGCRADHPMVEGRFKKLHRPPRTRYVEDTEILAVLSLPPMRRRGSIRMLQAYIKLKLLTGRRRSELLRLRVSDLQEDGVHFTLTKTVKKTGQAALIVEWTPLLRAAVNEALATRPIDIAPWVFCTKRGECYGKADGSANGWDSLWQRFMARLLTETDLKERFTEHDLRAKCASDAKSLEHAQQLLAHASPATTKRVYRRKPEHVKPLG
ncbi:MAG: tyrosine-type recombinase/integrase [Acidiferrobacteraceae bacterium]